MVSLETASKDPHGIGVEATTTNALATKLGITAVSVSSEEGKFTMPVDGNTQVAGVLHGGATAALCENAASACANVHAHQSGKIAVGTEMSTSHLRPAGNGTVSATATAVHLGKRRAVHKVDVHDERGRVVSTALVTNMIVEI